MNKIKILSKEVYSKIAAGEVIDRPASIVRELIDNSIDAGSNIITVYVENGGIDKITVSDDGTGINKEDLKLALSMHATSKINDFEDLLNIYTMGFRGEALYSIQTISKLTITSNTDQTGKLPGYKITNDDINKLDSLSFKKGTKVEISDIFYNVPARKKFLKSASSEWIAIKNIVILKAFSFLNISFKVFNNNEPVFKTGGDNDFKKTFFNIYKNENNFDIHEIEKKINDDIKIKIYFSPADVYFSNRKYMELFVNKRSVNINFFYSALDNAVRNFISPGRFPLVFIYLDINPSLLDINIHPAKKEIKFSDQNLIFKIIQNSVMEGYSNNISRDILKNRSIILNDFNNVINNSDNDEIKILNNEKQNYFNYFNEVNKDNYIVSSENKNYDDFIMLGTVFDTYILIQKDDKVYIIDQHAACESIIYKRKLEKYKSNYDIEKLLIPVIFDLDKENNDVDKKIELLNNNKFLIERHEGSSVIIKEAPSILLEKKDYNVLADLVKDYLESDQKNDFDIIDKIIAEISCKESIKKGDKLSTLQTAEIVKEYFDNNIVNCPHGRPIHFEISKENLEKIFQRKN